WGRRKPHQRECPTNRDAKYSHHLGQKGKSISLYESLRHLCATLSYGGQGSERNRGTNPFKTGGDCRLSHRTHTIQKRFRRSHCANGQPSLRQCLVRIHE